MTTPWERFATVARHGTADQIPVALIVDSPWLPGYAGIDTLDYFLREDDWLRINRGLLERFPEVAWIPGFWIEYGMAAEPSAFGARVLWHHDRPPSIEAVPGGLAAVADMEPPDPTEHGMMPLVLQRYASLERYGIHPQMVAARGPFAVANWVIGASDLMLGLASDPDTITRFLDTVTTTIIRFLHAQLDTLRDPQGILVLDGGKRKRDVAAFSVAHDPRVDGVSRTVSAGDEVREEQSAELRVLIVPLGIQGHPVPCGNHVAGQQRGGRAGPGNGPEDEDAAVVVGEAEKTALGGINQRSPEQAGGGHAFVGRR